MNKLQRPAPLPAGSLASRDLGPLSSKLCWGCGSLASFASFAMMVQYANSLQQCNARAKQAVIHAISYHLRDVAGRIICEYDLSYSEFTLTEGRQAKSTILPKFGVATSDL